MSTQAPALTIRAVARRTGLSPDVIRAWERRYEAVRPRRSPTARRLYSESDVERLVLLRRATLAGRRIGEIAGLDLAALTRLVREDEAAIAAAPRPTPGPAAGATAFRVDALEALERMDGEMVEAVLHRAARELSTSDLVEQVIGPLMRTVGERWRDGSLGIGHEHLATVLVRGLLSALHGARPHNPGGPRLVLCTPAHEPHELGALMASVMAAGEGWQAIYLGAELPALDIAAAVEQSGAQAVALSVVHPSPEPAVSSELRTLRRLLDDDLPILLGGAAAAAHAALLDHPGIRPVRDWDEFRSALARQLPS